MQRDVRPCRGMGCRRKIVGVGFPLDLEDGHGDRVGELRFGGEPFRGGPAVHHLFGEAVVRRELHQLVEGVVDEQGAAQALRCACGKLLIIVLEKFNQGCDVVAANHRSQQLDRLQW